MADIADRLERSRESIRLWITGERGPGAFPLPQHNALGRSRLWRWSQVLDWIDEHQVAAVHEATLELAHAIEDANTRLRSPERSPAR